MFDHVGLDVRDFSKSLEFFTKALAPLGLVPQSVDEKARAAGFGPPGAPALWISVKPKAAGPMHLALVARDREAVKGFHAAAVAAGGRDNGPPGPRADYGAGYYAAFVLDPDGNNIEAVVHER